MNHMRKYPVKHQAVIQFISIISAFVCADQRKSVLCPTSQPYVLNRTQNATVIFYDKMLCNGK